MVITVSCTIVQLAQLYNSTTVSIEQRDGLKAPILPPRQGWLLRINGWIAGSWASDVRVERLRGFIEHTHLASTYLSIFMSTSDEHFL